ncbi:DUF6778 family protein [Aliiroseovarius sp. PTFE2010]|uniref:DUF6778 family protein n=1 Tax=Aliiroseovarius sp. PTFE2010 TaxID=3417190 RepID=UPI003CF3E369
MRAKLSILICAATLAAGCSLPAQDAPTRGAPHVAALLNGQTTTSLDAQGITQTILQPDYRLRRVYVRVPDELEPSESNSYYPRADIVWHGDPFGDRHAQVKAVVQGAAERAIAITRGDKPVDLDIEVRRFHALSERTRYTVGGRHEFEFKLTFLNAETGLPLAPPRLVQAEIKGFGGLAAVRAEALGQTQKVRITDYLAQFVAQQTAMGPGA